MTCSTTVLTPVPSLWRTLGSSCSQEEAFPYTVTCPGKCPPPPPPPPCQVLLHWLPGLPARPQTEEEIPRLWVLHHLPGRHCQAHLLPPHSQSQLTALVHPVTRPPCPLHTQVLLVTGGYDGGSRLSSTELLPLSSPTTWTVAASLPRAVIRLRAASLPGGLYCAGGWDGSSDRDEVRTPLTPPSQ